MRKLLLALGLLTALPLVSAGNIDATYKWAWSEDIGWINFGATNGDVTVYDDRIEGYAWSQLLGWINLAPANAGVTNSNGTLDGHAWGEHLGYIDFDGVTIDDSGYFQGNANGTITGDISFNCANTASCGSSDFKVRTTWRPSISSSAPSGSGGGGGGGFSKPQTVAPTNVPKQDLKPAAPELEGKEDTGPSDGDSQVQVQEGEIRSYAFTYCTEEDIEVEALYVAPARNTLEQGIAGLSEALLSCEGDALRCPSGVLTRAAFVELLLSSQCEDRSIQGEKTFPDIAGHPLETSIRVAADQGWVKGYADGRFLPDRPIARVEAIAILVRYFKLPLEGVEDMRLQDVLASSWYASLAPEVARFGFLEETEVDGRRYLFPEAPIAREELRRALKSIERYLLGP